MYGIIHSLHLIRTLAIMVIWHKAKDPAVSSTKLEFFFGYWIFLAEIIWSIFGNFIIYSDTLNEGCVDTDQSDNIFTVQTLWVTCLVWIIYGYLLILGLICTCCFSLVFFKVKADYDKADAIAQENLKNEEERKKKIDNAAKFMERIPLM